jgi:hypothetical protein
MSSESATPVIPAEAADGAEGVEESTSGGGTPGEGGISKSELKRRLKAAEKEKEKAAKAVAKAEAAASKGGGGGSAEGGSSGGGAGGGGSAAAAEEELDPSKCVYFLSFASMVHVSCVRERLSCCVPTKCAELFTPLPFPLTTPSQLLSHARAAGTLTTAVAPLALGRRRA